MRLFPARRPVVVSAGYAVSMVLSSRVARALADLVLFLISAGAIVAAFLFSL
jgi:hypothetical protein